ncbi:hypothetical protein BDZ94DRAFT_869351 [Collybia nuda]|uniref:Uncharacterized protein n=1 Tax=Collybia nuda TaxID=64659 RepID=A0A9P6CHH6_9AGAR|nr:hypothetical protein BDZ94DRAFT_869351 [Collybia nuda]
MAWGPPVFTTIETLPSVFSPWALVICGIPFVRLAGFRINRNTFFPGPPNPRLEHQELPVRLGPDTTDMHRIWYTDKKFICTTLVQSPIHPSTPGADHDLVNALLAVEPPRSLKYMFGSELSQGLERSEALFSTGRIRYKYHGNLFRWLKIGGDGRFDIFP